MTRDVLEKRIWEALAAYDRHGRGLRLVDAILAAVDVYAPTGETTAERREQLSAAVEWRRGCYPARDGRGRWVSGRTG